MEKHNTQFLNGTIKKQNNAIHKSTHESAMFES